VVGRELGRGEKGLTETAEREECLILVEWVVVGGWKEADDGEGSEEAAGCTDEGRAGGMLA